MTQPKPPLSALSIAMAIDAGTLTAEQAIEQSLAAIEALDGGIAAFVALDPASARAHARSASGSLAGLTLGVKDVFETADFPTEMGSPIYAGFQSRGDAAVVAMARRAGATVVGKTSTTELQNRTVTTPTRNPRDPAHTPGGSSAGSAAAVAAGMIPVAIGAQTAGSIVRPAAYCGIAGFKPSFRLLPTVGLKAFSWSLDTVGLFAAGIADVAYFAEHLMGRPMRVDEAESGAPRIGLLRTHIWAEASPDMQQAVELAAALAAKAGATVIDLAMPAALIEAFEAHEIIQNYQAAQALAWEVDAHREAISPALLAVLDAGRAIPPDVYDRARGQAKRGRFALKTLFTEAGIDAILTPSATGVAPAGLDYTGDHAFNRLWTLMGTPAINVPGLTDAGGLPLGLQVIGPFGRDLACLQAAHFVECACRKA